MAAVESEVRWPEIPDDLPEEVETFLGYAVDNPYDEEEREEPRAPSQEVVAPIVPRIARRRRTLAERRARIEAMAQAEVARVMAWSMEQKERIDREASRCDLVLQGHHAWVLEGDPKAKTLQLPYGITCKMRAQQPEWQRDEDALLGWAQESAPEYVEMRPRLKWAELKRAAKVTPAGGAVLPATGEVLPSVQVAQRGPKFSVEVDLDG